MVLKDKCFAVQGDFSFYEKTWKNITSSAKQLITDLLQVDPERRPSAQDVRIPKALTYWSFPIII
jgi:calcium-dependent protein kinase